MTYTYCMRKDIIHDEEKKEYVVYGIEVISHKGKLLLSFPDVFFDRKKAEHFVKLCNEAGLSLIHLPCAIEDALAELG